MVGMVLSGAAAAAIAAPEQLLPVVAGSNSCSGFADSDRAANKFGSTGEGRAVAAAEPEGDERVRLAAVEAGEAAAEGFIAAGTVEPAATVCPSDSWFVLVNSSGGRIGQV